MAGELAAQSKIDSRESFNSYCRAACRLWAAHFPEKLGQTTEKFAELVLCISRKLPGVIPTSWGGAVVTRHEPPKVEKYLVIRQGGYLALEKHEQKDEHLKVQEGAGLILSRSSADCPLTVEALEPGRQFHFEPGMEHCIIGTEDLLVFERSTDPKGMDQDLIFLYEPTAAPKL
ncbi:MAG: hypothetical protein ABIT76_04145 [Chthoniobacterales bacterium]